MTSRHATGFLSLREPERGKPGSRVSDTLYRLAFGAIGWPWLLFSLWGGTKRSKKALLARVALHENSLPHLGSWKADTGFLHRIVDAVEELRPGIVVELGAGATSLVCAKALEQNGGGRLISFDQHPGFVDATRDWIAAEGASADLRWAPLNRKVEGWPGQWYAVRDLPEQIDLLIIDGPPWSIHPFVRGAAECLFDRLSPGGMVLLDDAWRPGERIVARRWQDRWPEMSFQRVRGSTKGTLVGRKSTQGDTLPAPTVAANDNFGLASLRRAAAVALLLGAGWFANEISHQIAPPAHAASLVDEAQEAYTASQARQLLASHSAKPSLDTVQVLASTGLELPVLPAEWSVVDVQLYPSDLGNSLMASVTTANGEKLSLFAARAETPAGELPLMETSNGTAVAYWEEGPMAFAVMGEISAPRLLQLAAIMARDSAPLPPS